jgi:hypothetical protein
MPDWAFFYRNPLARQQFDAAIFQSENSRDGLRKSRHGCQPEQRVSLFTTLHFAYLRRLHVWFETLPVSVVHFTTTF